MSQIYSTAQAGNLDQAQVMIQQVLISHPNSAKAHFVRAELYARQNDFARARESLATAEKFSPGLSFAKPEAVSTLRAQISGKAPQRSTSGSIAHAAPVQSQPSNTSWALPLLLAAGVIAAGYFIFRRKTPVADVQGPMYANPNALSGPQNFGMGAPGGGMQPGYPQYPQQAGSGLGGRIMGGVATGLAVGAGVMAAEAIGRSLTGNHNAASAGQLDNAGNRDFQPNANPDMGGANFGVNDSSSWDSGSADMGGGGDWDN
jgi:hypothetical protein